MPTAPHRFADALAENPSPRLLGDVRFVYEPGRLMGTSQHPSLALRSAPGALLALSAGAALGFVLALGSLESSLGMPALALAAVSAGAGAAALWLERRLGRRRFVLHFASETLRIQPPGGRRARTALVPFGAVVDVQVVERALRRYAVFVVYRLEEGAPEERAVLIDSISPAESDALHRVWRMLQNAFGLSGARFDET